MTGISPDEPGQEALFYLEGPDERGCVWAHGASSSDPWTRNLGPAAKVAEVISQWLASTEYDQQEQLKETARRSKAVEDEKRQAKRLRKEARPKDHRDEGGQG